MAKVSKTNEPASVLHGKMKMFDKHRLAGFFQKYFRRFVANPKTLFIFAPELNPLERTNSSAKSGDVFVSDNLPTSIGCCSRLKVAHKALLSVPKQRVSTVFFYFKTLFFSQMERTKNNATGAQGATASRPTDVNRISGQTTPAGKTDTYNNVSKTPITLSLTGVKNPYLFSLRKIFHEFLQEETYGWCCNEYRLKSKIEAARLLFPEARQELRYKTVKI